MKCLRETSEAEKICLFIVLSLSLSLSKVYKFSARTKFLTIYIIQFTLFYLPSGIVFNIMSVYSFRINVIKYNAIMHNNTLH